MKTILPTTLSFLRRAHLLHGFLACFLLWNLIGAGVFSGIATIDGREVLLSQGAPLAFFLLSLAFSLLIGFLWDSAMGQNAKWAKRREEERGALYTAEFKLGYFRAFYGKNPDFLSAEILKLGEPDTILLHVKAAPHGHPWPSKWDGMNVIVIVAPMDQWEHFQGVRAAQG